MFEHAIANLNTELDGLRARLSKCAELLEKVQDSERKVKLNAQYDVIREAIDRAALCLDILNYRVSMDVSPDCTGVRFLPVVEAAADNHMRLLGMPVAKAVEIWRLSGSPVIHLEPSQNCLDLEKMLSHSDVPEKHLLAVRRWLDSVVTKGS